MSGIIRNLLAALFVTAFSGLSGIHGAAARSGASAALLTPVKVDGKRFIQDGREVILNGVNYFPAYFPAGFPDSWMKVGNYHPKVVEEDLATIRALGANLVSVAAVGSGARPEEKDCANIRDFLDRAGKHGLLVNLYIGTGSGLPIADPASLAFLPKVCALAGHPALFAYDIAWEPHFGSAAERRGLMQRWRSWLEGAYATEASAQAAFAGNLSLPTDDELCSWAPSVKVAAFRRFLDDVVNASYREARAAIHAVDSTHLIGVRSGWGGNGSRQLCRGAPPDLRAGVRHLDFISPEGHALPPTNRAEVMHRGGFTAAYADVGKPVFWAEYGVNVDGSCPYCNEEIQAAFFSNIFDMMRKSASNGGAAWWFVGVRPQSTGDKEKSDFGMVSDHPNSVAGRKLRPAARQLKGVLDGVSAANRVYSKWITVDRDTAAGDWKMYDSGTNAYATLAKDVERVGVRTTCSGASSREAPLCVGNMANNGSCPPKCLNAEWVSIEIRNANGVWQTIRNNDEVVVRDDQPVRVRLKAGNTGEGTWLAKQYSLGIAGSVRFGCNENAGDIACRHDLAEDVGFLGETPTTELLLIERLAGKTKVVLQMVAEQVAWFGERMTIRLSPRGAG